MLCKIKQDLLYEGYLLDEIELGSDGCWYTSDANGEFDINISIIITIFILTLYIISSY